MSLLLRFVRNGVARSVTTHRTMRRNRWLHSVPKMSVLRTRRQAREGHRFVSLGSEATDRNCRKAAMSIGSPPSLAEGCR